MNANRLLAGALILTILGGASAARAQMLGGSLGGGLTGGLGSPFGTLNSSAQGGTYGSFGPTMDATGAAERVGQGATRKAQATKQYASSAAIPSAATASSVTTSAAASVQSAASAAGQAGAAEASDATASAQSTAGAAGQVGVANSSGTPAGIANAEVDSVNVAPVLTAPGTAPAPPASVPAARPVAGGHASHDTSAMLDNDSEGASVGALTSVHSDGSVQH